MKRSRVAGAVLTALADKMAPRRPADWERYFALLSRAAALGDAEAQENLGNWYLEGKVLRAGRVILPRTPMRGAKLLRLAADAGNALAQVSLGHCYEAGLGVRRSLDAAVEQYRRAARGRQWAAAWNLSVVAGQRGDRAGQLRWLRRSAEWGSQEAALELTKRERAARRRSTREGGRGP